PDGRVAVVFFFSSRRRHTRSKRDWSSDVCSSDLVEGLVRRSGAGVLTAAGGGTAGLTFPAVLSAGVSGLGTGVAAEHLVERLVEGRGEADVLSEGHEHVLQQRVGGLAGGPDVDRLHVEQTVADGQREQVAVLHLGLTLTQQVEA